LRTSVETLPCLFEGHFIVHDVLPLLQRRVLGAVSW
jgi:hypothetical protein